MLLDNGFIRSPIAMRDAGDDGQVETSSGAQRLEPKAIVGVERLLSHVGSIAQRLI